MKYILLACLLISTHLWTQNLVVDGGFETIINFEEKNNNWYQLKGTPDLWDTSGFCSTKTMVINIDKFHIAHNGRKYLGLLLEENRREAVSGILREPMKKDSVYEISMYAKRADERVTLTEHYPLKNFPVAFATNDENWEKLPYVPLMTIDRAVVENKWTKIQGKYKAKGGENRIIIGGFRGIYLIMNENGNNDTYYLFDDVFIKYSTDNRENKTAIISENKIENDELPIIYFDTNSAEIKAAEKAKLEAIIKILKENKNLAITISGFTDSDGNDALNAALGEKRAKNVKDFLLQFSDFDTESIGIKSYGKSLSFNDLSKAKNRRVQLNFTAKPWNKYQKEAIAAVAKLYGYVRWFYPVKYPNDFNWDNFLHTTLIQLSAIKDSQNLRQFIQFRFSKIAPELRFFNSSQACFNYKKSIKTLPNLMYKKWVNEGMGDTENKNYDRQLMDCKALNKAFITRYKNQDYTFNDAELIDTLPLSIFAYLPLILPEKKPNLIDLKNDLMPTINDTIAKYNWMVSGIVLWNSVQHFYPYLSALNINWQPRIYSIIDAINSLNSEHDFLDKMKGFVVELKDGHARFNNKSRASNKWLKFENQLIDNQLVVSNSFDEKIKENDVLMDMDGQSLMEKFKHDTALISGTKNWKINQGLASLTSNKPFGTTSKITVKRDNSLLYFELKRDWENDTFQGIKKLKNDLIYLELSRLDWHIIDSIFKELNQSKGVIFDMRKYLNDDSLTQILNHLLTIKDTANSWIHTPIYLFPNQKNVVFNKEGWDLMPLKPHLSCPVVFLIGGGAISANESMLGLIKHYKLGTLIGEKTAGSNGSRNWINLPNNYLFSWTGMYVTLPDGSPLQNVGIEPDILAIPNPHIHVYKDYILKTAIDYLELKNKQ